MDLRLDHQTFRVHEQVALPALNPLARVEAPIVPAHPRGLDALAVHDPRARFGVPPEPDPHPPTKRLVQPLPGAVDAPEAEVVVDGLPGREVVREQPPGAAAAHDVAKTASRISRGGWSL